MNAVLRYARSPAGVGWLTFLGLAILLELARRLDWVSPIIIASPSDVVRAFGEGGPEFLGAFLVTLGEIVRAVVLCWSLGLLVGLVAGSVPALNAAVAPILISLFAVPLVMLYPLFTVWFGLGSLSKIIFAAIAGFFPIALNTMNGVRQLELRYFEFGRSIGASRTSILLRIMLPLALPAIMSGLRVGTSLVVVNVVVAEMLASVAGLGFWISYHRNLFNTGHVYLGILLALVCVILVNSLLSRIESHYGKWNPVEP